MSEAILKMMKKIRLYQSIFLVGFLTNYICVKIFNLDILEYINYYPVYFGLFMIWVSIEFYLKSKCKSAEGG